MSALSPVRRLLLAAVVPALLAVPAAVPAGASTHARVPVGAAPSPGTGGGGWAEQQPTQQEMDDARARVARLGAAADQAQGAVDAADAALAVAAQKSGLALEAYSIAVRKLQVAQQAERQQQDQLAQVNQQLAASRAQLGRWVRSAYQGGSELNTNATLNVLLQGDVTDSADLSTTLNVLQRVGNDRSDALTAVQLQSARQARLTEAAGTAAETAAAAAVGAGTARKAADEALQEQRVVLGTAETDLSDTRGELQTAKERQSALSAQSLLGGGGAYVGSSQSGENNRVTGQVGACRGGDTIEQYANGQIPLSALCPLWTDPRHHLRADAAFAFDRLSKDYAAHFGSRICITDSYRSLAEQISVYARKPGLAARPGTSNHGWGTATDLCGGIQTFGSSQHAWMKVNAPLYGWFHPAWAEPGGSKPEAWHWEFGG